MRFKKMRDMIASALLLFALLCPSVANGQTDNFFYVDEGLRDGDDVGSWNGFGFGGTAAENHASWDDMAFQGIGSENSASWESFEFDDPLPAGTGLLVLALSGVCYGTVKVKRLKTKN